jgi:single-strand DNA-binding protein
MTEQIGHHRLTTQIGNLTRDPTLRFSAKGAAWTTMALAVDCRSRSEDGAWVARPAQFYDVVCFGSLAENVAECLAKGDRVVIVGRIEDTKWVGRDGTERTGQRIVADDIGASLRRSSVEVTRTTRREPDQVARWLEATTPDELFGVSS